MVGGARAGAVHETPTHAKQMEGCGQDPVVFCWRTVQRVPRALRSPQARCSGAALPAGWCQGELTALLQLPLRASGQPEGAADAGAGVERGVLLPVISTIQGSCSAWAAVMRLLQSRSSMRDSRARAPGDTPCQAGPAKWMGCSCTRRQYSPCTWWRVEAVVGGWKALQRGAGT